MVSIVSNRFYGEVSKPLWNYTHVNCIWSAVETERLEPQKAKHLNFFFNVPNY